MLKGRVCVWAWHRLKVEHKLGLLRCRTQVEAFLRGLHEPLPRESMMCLSKFVSVAEVSVDY